GVGLALALVTQQASLHTLALGRSLCLPQRHLQLLGRRIRRKHGNAAGLRVELWKAFDDECIFWVLDGLSNFAPLPQRDVHQVIRWYARGRWQSLWQTGNGLCSHGGDDARPTIHDLARSPNHGDLHSTGYSFL